MKNMKNLVIEEPPNSLIVTANKKIYVPEKKIILMEQVTEMVPLHKGSLFLSPDPPFHRQLPNMLEGNFTFNPGYNSFYCTSLKHNFSVTSSTPAVSSVLAWLNLFHDPCTLKGCWQDPVFYLEGIDLKNDENNAYLKSFLNLRSSNSTASNGSI